ncbi:MAG: CRISPR-associated protein Cas4 [Gemmatimonadota bacterium]|nr:CRISPR-associated protein Cas4 [Gemmatimonadota bacterium]MDH5758900.1 CRISPR-associated protein Cas4 [Gemmatimonadota bacterium]
MNTLAGSMFDEDDLLPLSALQHMVFCERQAGLIHLEQTWADNAYTVEGDHLHRIVDGMSSDLRSDVLTRRGVTLKSFRLGVIGRADVVEFHSVDRVDSEGVCLPGRTGRWRPVPVEYKRGRPKAHRADEVQLCAQAMCLEEAFAVAVGTGVLFYGRTRRRSEVILSAELRALTERTAERLHTMMRSGRTPVCARTEQCDRCSLEPVCLPPSKSSKPSVRAYLDGVLSWSIKVEDQE